MSRARHLIFISSAECQGQGEKSQIIQGQKKKKKKKNDNSNNLQDTGVGDN